MKSLRLLLAILGILSIWFLSAHAAEPSSAVVRLTPQEQQWLRDHPVIRLAPDPDFKPIEYFDHDGVYRGAAADIVGLLQKKLGLKITIVRLKNWDEVMEKFRKHEIDLLGAIVKTPSREKFALFTDPILSVPGGIFTRDSVMRKITLDDLKGKKVAVVSNYTAYDVLKNLYPNIILDVVPDVSVGLAKASLGMVDAYVENMASATCNLQETGITNLRLVGTTNFDYRWAIGIRKDWPEIQGILNKGLATIGNGERQEAINRWISIKDVGWKPGKTFVVGVAASILGLLLAVSWVWNRSLRKAKAAALSNEMRFRMFFRSVTDSVYIADAGRRIIVANQQASSDTGYSPEELLRMKITDIEVSDVAGKVGELFQENMAGKVTTFDGIHQRKDGTRFPVETSVRAIDYDGRPAILGVARNVTARKQAEDELRESESRYRSIFNYGSDGIVIVDPDTATPVDFNNQACTQLGYTREEFGGLKISDIDLLEGPGEVKARIQGVIDTGYDEFETVHRTKQGERRNVHVKAQNILVGGKSVYHCIWRDITDRKRAEAEKEKLQAQLQQAMKMEAVGRLAGGVAHDFNNLLTVITGYSELLLQKIGKESPMRGEVEEIRRAGERAASLTQQLLAFSRKQIIEPRVVQLDSLVAEMHKMLTRLIGEDIALQAITGKSLGSVKVDPGQFQQILMNLVVNARDAMPGGGKIVIETSNVGLDEGYCASHPYVKPGQFVMLSVSDTGQGMSDEVKAHVFEPFFTTKERGSGTGLGLAMTYGAVHQAGGSIEVYSEVGIGTTFKIYLPRVDEEAVKPVKDDRPTEAPGGTETVLIVEDEEIVRNLGVRILGRLGYKVRQARNGAEAIAEAQGYGERIDLLLTDVVMPGMNGSELATQLVLQHPEMKVLFTSGYTEDVITHHGVLAEGVSFIGKPYTPKALARKVREVLDEA